MTCPRKPLQQHKGFPPSAPSPRNHFFTLKKSVVCTGFAVRADSNGISFDLKEGFQGGEANGMFKSPGACGIHGGWTS